MRRYVFVVVVMNFSSLRLFVVNYWGFVFVVIIILLFVVFVGVVLLFV